jgi:hypothetical protein
VLEPIERQEPSLLRGGDEQVRADHGEDDVRQPESEGGR